MNKLLHITMILLAGCTPTGNKSETGPIVNFTTLIEAVPEHSVFAEKGYYVWGASVVKGKYGLYHMFYSRWKSELGFNAWVTHSEIAHAVSHRPDGPFTFKDVALPPRGAKYWDGLTTHNPTVQQFDGRYYLYYMGNTGQGISLAFFVSEDGLNWEPSGNPLASRLEIRWEDGITDKVKNLERAQVLTENGDPVMLYYACAKEDPFTSETFNVHIPLKKIRPDNN